MPSTGLPVASVLWRLQICPDRGSKRHPGRYARSRYRWYRWFAGALSGPYIERSDLPCKGKSLTQIRSCQHLKCQRQLLALRHHKGLERLQEAPHACLILQPIRTTGTVVPIDRATEAKNRTDMPQHVFVRRLLRELDHDPDTDTRAKICAFLDLCHNRAISIKESGDVCQVEIAHQLNLPSALPSAEPLGFRRYELVYYPTVAGGESSCLLRPQDATSRHRGAKPCRRCGRLGKISLLSPG